jgi:hypothetical protein
MVLLTSCREMMPGSSASETAGSINPSTVGGGSAAACGLLCGSRRGDDGVGSGVQAWLPIVGC